MKGKEKEKFLKRIDGICETLSGILKLDQKQMKDSRLHQELITLAYGSKHAVKEYYLKKIRRMILAGTAGTGLVLLCLLAELGNEGGKGIDFIKRPDYGAGDRLEWMDVQADGEKESYEMEITVRERTYTDEEKKKLLEQAVGELEAVISGENRSLDEVRQNLILPTSLVNDAVQVSWVTVPYGVIEEDGTLIGAEDKNGTLVELQGTLTCGTEEQIYTVFVKVFPPELSEEEQLKADIKKAVELADARESHEEVLELPEEAGGRSLIWSQEDSGAAGIVFVMMLIVTAGIYVQMDSEVHKRAEQRKQQLMMDYPDLMWKMTMLLGAGQSIRGTFCRIAEEYRKKEKKMRWVYEEVCITCLEMKSGIAEAQAYERFGKRCQLPEYIRLGTVLSQNLKKGSAGLTGMLEKEAETAMNERKNHVRKMGEEAGTKLLFPMVLMLGVVLAVLMIPAFMAF